MGDLIVRSITCKATVKASLYLRSKSVAFKKFTGDAKLSNTLVEIILAIRAAPLLLRIVTIERV